MASLHLASLSNCNEFILHSISIPVPADSLHSRGWLWPYVVIARSSIESFNCSNIQQDFLLPIVISVIRSFSSVSVWVWVSGLACPSVMSAPFFLTLYGFFLLFRTPALVPLILMPWNVRNLFTINIIGLSCFPGAHLGRFFKRFFISSGKSCGPGQLVGMIKLMRLPANSPW